MPKLKWDASGERFFETGVDHGVLYVRDENGEYPEGVVWNGLTTVTESPSGAEPQPQYADNQKYLNLRSAEEFGCTIEAFTCPREFYACDGSATPRPGLRVGQQTRLPFGFVWRTRLGNDLKLDDYGYRLHLAYGLSANPSERANATVNDSPEATGLSWEITSDPVPFEDESLGLKPTAILTIDSVDVPAADLADLEAILFGSETEDARLPLPDEIVELIPEAVAGP